MVIFDFANQLVQTRSVLAELERFLCDENREDVEVITFRTNRSFGIMEFSKEDVLLGYQSHLDAVRHAFSRKLEGAPVRDALPDMPSFSDLETFQLPDQSCCIFPKSAVYLKLMKPFTLTSASEEYSAEDRLLGESQIKLSIDLDSVYRIASVKEVI